MKKSLVLIMLSLICIAGCSSEESSPLSSAPAIIFTSDLVEYEEPGYEASKYTPEIYSMSPDGTGLVRLTETIGPEQHPECSPDGTKIAYDFKNYEEGAETGIYIMESNGKNITRLSEKATQDHRPSWSPDGNRIVFESYRDGNAEIYGMDADGSNQTRLTSSPANDICPSWWLNYP